jgi:hypothetical protein
MGIIDGGVAVGDFHMPPPFQRREHHEQIGDAIAFVFAIVTRLASRLRGDWRARLDDQLLPLPARPAPPPVSRRGGAIHSVRCLCAG